MKNEDTILYLINPSAHDGNAVLQWKQAREKYPFLPKQPIDITTVSLKEILLKQKPTIVVIAGGDGTINHVCRVVAQLQKKPLLAVLPLGTGNALSHSLGVETIEKAITVLQEKKYTVTIDLMKTTIPAHEIAVFNIGVGFDARIVHMHHTTRYIGFRSYVLAAFRSLLSHQTRLITITIDHKVKITATASALMIANGPIIGFNYLVAQHAKLNDGFLDCTLFPTKYAYVTNLRLQGFKHPLYSELGKVHFKAKHIRIEGEPFVQTDGDPVVYNSSIEIEIAPLQVTFLRNADDKINQVSLPFLKYE